MTPKQTTLKSPVKISGVGLHTGLNVDVIIKPTESGHGYKFKRVDLPDQPIVEADCDLVTDTSRGTTLEKNGVKIGTVEHVLAALAGLEIDNALIEINSTECPIMDGSARMFVEAIIEVGVKVLDADREYFEIPHNVHYRDESGDVEMVAMPLENYRLTVMVDYNSPVLGSQHATITDLKEFKDEIAGCRTFCFLHELEAMLEANLIKGGDLNNAIVIVDKPVTDSEMQRLADLFGKPKIEVRKEGILNNLELRFQNEPARHKLLDMIGDLALIGKPIKAQIMAARPGHAANVAFARKIKTLMKKIQRSQKNDVPRYDPNEKPIFDNKAISKLLPHKYPFLFVDKVIAKTDTSIIAIKNITADEYFFQGHFPDDPIMPGVLQLEAMAQAGGVLILSEVPDPENYGTYFLKIENAKFKDKVVPGDTLILKMELIEPIRRGICVMRGKAFVGNNLVCEAEMMAQVVKIR